MTKIEISPATAPHALAVATNMRPADQREIWARSRHTPAEAMRVFLDVAVRAWAGQVNGQTVCVFGVAELAPGVGSPALLGTPGLESIPLAFARRCKPYLAQMLALYPTLINEVHADNQVSLRWLRWLGFKIETTPRLYHGEKFYLFQLNRQEVNYV